MGKTRSLLLLSMVTLVLLSCGQRVPKDVAISKFEEQIDELCRSSEGILAKAVEDIENGVDPQVIASRIKEPLQQKEHQIDSISQAFHPIAKDAGLTKSEWDSVYQNVGQKVQPMMDMYNALKQAGVEI